MLLLPCSMASAEVTGACLNDAKAQCPGVQPGGGKIRDCLKTHFKDLSDACQTVMLKEQPRPVRMT
jgi:Cysteine rich repeat